MQPEAIFSHPVASYLREESNTYLTTTAFQVSFDIEWEMFAPNKLD